MSGIALLHSSCHPADQLDVGVEHLLLLEGQLLLADEVTHPAGVRMGRLAAGSLHHPVEGDELGDDQLPHLTPLTRPAGGRLSSRRRWL